MPDSYVKQYRNIPIPKGWAELVVSDRVLCGDYVTKATGSAKQVNKKVRAAAFFCYLKSLSTSGKVNYSPKPFSDETGLSDDVVRRRVDDCIDRGWIEVAADGGLLLRSFTSIMEAEESAYTSCYQLRWELGNFDVLRYAFPAIEIWENQQRTDKAYNVRIKIRGFRAALESIGITDRATHLRAQETALQSGSEHPKELLLCANADTERSAKTIRRAHGYKSKRSVGFLKRRLEEIGLAEIIRRHLPTYCGQSAISAIPKNGIRTNRWHQGYNPESQVRTTHLPDQIKIKPFFQ